MNKCLECSINLQSYTQCWLVGKSILVKILTNNSAAGEWSKFGHKDLILITLLKASSRFWIKGELRQKEDTNVKLWPHLIIRRCYVII